MAAIARSYRVNSRMRRISRVLKAYSKVYFLRTQAQLPAYTSILRGVRVEYLYPTGTVAALAHP